jgi:hypothetical protein
VLTKLLTDFNIRVDFVAIFDQLKDSPIKNKATGALTTGLGSFTKSDNGEPVTTKSIEIVSKDYC